MNVLVFNAGSNSLKFQVIAAERGEPDRVRGKKLFSDVIEPVTDYGEAAQEALRRLDLHGVELVAHRVVHGAHKYDRAVVVDDGVIRTIEELEDLAPLHNIGALEAIRATRDMRAVAVFDTAFHRTIPDRARFYPIPWELTEKYDIQRYGFHGISHKYMMLRYAEITGTPVEQTNIVTLHLEGGSSAAAIQGGKALDTSMGFTPLEGLMMGTRSGDIDPALVAYLARKENIDAGQVEELLNKKSGLLGVSGESQDTRELVPRLEENRRVRLALEMFAYRVRKYIGAYVAALGNAEAVVFGGGISENTPEVRALICEGLQCLGLDFDPKRNLDIVDREGLISRDWARLRAHVIPTEEGLMIAHEAVQAS